MKLQRTYVLVHGAWHGGWVWQSIAADLRAMGHIVYAPSLTGLGDRKHLRRPGINLDTHADDIVHLVTMEGLDDIGITLQHADQIAIVKEFLLEGGAT